MRLPSSVAALMISLAASHVEAQEVRASARVATTIPTTRGSLTSAQISAGLWRGRVQIQECVHANLPTNLTFPGLRVEVRLAISRDGTVTRVEHVHGSTDASEALTTCLVQVASQMRFEAAAETTMAAFAWVLRPPPVSFVPAPPR